MNPEQLHQPVDMQARSETDPPLSNEAVQLSFLEPSAAFDEMNLVETPFSLLTNDTRGLQSLALSEGGNERVVAEDGGLLPNSLADRAVLGLMWLSNQQSRLKSPVVRFALRDLVCHYMFPARYSRIYTPSQRILRAVEDQINRVAFTRLVTNRWYDKRLGKQTRINASIIDYVQVINEGGRNQPRILELRWGDKFYRSLADSYTKPIDVEICRQINHPLDLRLYRWLDRQLQMKDIQKINSIQAFNRTKLLMTGQKIEGGGRRASTYIAQRLEEAIKRLDNIGYSVRMVIDSSKPDFSLDYIKLADEGKNEVVVEDLPGNLVRLFYRFAHGKEGRRRLSKSDREAAAALIKVYSYEQSVWMVERAAELQRELKRPMILTFAGLEQYEQVTATDYERMREERAGQLRFLATEERKAAFERYRIRITRLSPPIQRDTIEEEARVRAEATEGYRVLGPTAREHLLRATLNQLIRKAQNALTEEEFFAFANQETLREALISRHGSDFVTEKGEEL